MADGPGSQEVGFKNRRGKDADLATPPDSTLGQTMDRNARGGGGGGDGGGIFGKFDEGSQVNNDAMGIGGFHARQPGEMPASDLLGQEFSRPAGERNTDAMDSARDATTLGNELLAQHYQESRDSGLVSSNLRPVPIVDGDGNLKGFSVEHDSSRPMPGEPLPGASTAVTMNRGGEGGGGVSGFFRGLFGGGSKDSSGHSGGGSDSGTEPAGVQNRGRVSQGPISDEVFQSLLKDVDDLSAAETARNRLTLVLGRDRTAGFRQQVNDTTRGGMRLEKNAIVQDGIIPAAEMQLLLEQMNNPDKQIAKAAADRYYAAVGDARKHGEENPNFLRIKHEKGWLSEADASKFEAKLEAQRGAVYANLLMDVGKMIASNGGVVDYQSLSNYTEDQLRQLKNNLESGRGGAQQSDTENYVG